MDSHMKSNDPTNLKTLAEADLEQRIALVMSACTAHGYVNRKLLVTMYKITQQQAGSLMRDFLEIHAKNTDWDLENLQYKLKD